jgi:MinD superfamily P-loop ATPase
MELCRFDAIEYRDGFFVDVVRCEGCAFCYRACPSKAIEMISEERGKIFISETAYGDFVYALLEPGEENSGLLVSEVKKIAKSIAEEKGLDLVLIDAPPGIGCPVIASLSNVDVALVVTEPTLSGISDMKRVLELARHFNVKSFVVINKYDLNSEMSKKIERFCEEQNVKVIGKIPFDESVPKRIANLEIPEMDEIVEIWENVKSYV